ncbi:FAD-dependent oxidoreductase [Longispora albida]|uniref:FAD-dependent oxidoreductase n=1 Tax=Longispora albida TaxID=203523 RepID=UPI00036F69B8|nr:FAD-dependent oxidoreductase [Longispora albida]
MPATLPGQPTSLWTATAADDGYPQLAGDDAADVAVIGGGIAGLTTAWVLSNAGKSVVLLEAGRIGAGVTGHTTGKVTSLHRLAYQDLPAGTAALYGRANQLAVEYVTALAGDQGIDCGLREVDNYTFAESAAGLARVRREAELTASLGLPASFTTEVPLPFAVRGAVKFQRQAQIHAVRYLHGLAKAVTRAGGRIFENTTVSSFGDGRVVTEKGAVYAKDVVVATNMPFTKQGLFMFRCHPHRSYLVAAPLAGELWDGTFISADEPLRSILTTRIDGENYVLAGGEGHPVSEAVTDQAERYRRLAAYATDRLGAGSAAYRWSTQDGVPLDGIPYAGPVTPWNKHVQVITGLRKWGLSNGTACALAVADRILGRVNPFISLYDSNRFTPIRSAARFVTANLATARAMLRRPASRGLPGPGEAGVIQRNGKPVAVYTEPDGQAHAVSAVCTHQGCTVEWNSGDLTWDCPCHGSRYQPDGQVIHGPAVKPLAPAD